jgi:hypothetical protein
MTSFMTSTPGWTWPAPGLLLVAVVVLIKVVSPGDHRRGGCSRIVRCRTASGRYSPPSRTSCLKLMIVSEIDPHPYTPHARL